MEIAPFHLVKSITFTAAMLALIRFCPRCRFSVIPRKCQKKNVSAPTHGARWSLKRIESRVVADPFPGIVKFCVRALPFGNSDLLFES